MAGMVGCFKNRNSDSTAMASGPPDVMANQEPAEVAEECSGKKKSKFQTFKKFFARKKRKEPPAAGADAGLKASQLSDNVSNTSENNTLTRSEKDKGSGSKISLGSKALSHDSVFVSDSSEANEALGASQDSIHGKVKSLQLQLKQAIRLGSPPSLMCVKKMEDAGTMSEDDGLPCSPPEYTTLHTVMNQAQRNSSISLEGMNSDDDQLSFAASSRAVSPLVVPGDFSQPASPFGCLDNSAAKHKLGLRHKACNRRKPVSRLEMKVEGDSVVEDTLNTSITEAFMEREQHKTTEVVSADKLKVKVDREDEEEAEEAQCSRQSLLSDKEERDEAENQSEPEQDVCASPPTELCPSGEEVPDSQPQPSSQPSSRASSVDSPRVTPEPPAGLREYLMGPAGIANVVEENRIRTDPALRREEAGVQETREEENSFLQEVLSSLKTPLVPHSLGMETEGTVLGIPEEVKEKEREAVQIDEGEEIKEEEVQVEEKPVTHQAALAASLLSEEEEEVVTLSTRSPSCKDTEEQDKVEDEEERASEEEEEKLVVEQFNHYSQEEEGQDEEEAEEFKPEEQTDTLTGNTVNQVEEESREEEEEEEEEREGEEEVIELEKEPEVEEERWEKREEDNEQVEGKERAEEAEEVTEKEREDAEEMTVVFPDAEDEVQIATKLQGADEGADDALYGPQHTDSDETSTEMGNQELPADCKEREDGEEKVEGGVEVHSTEQKSDQEEDGKENQPAADQTEQDVEQEGVKASHLENEYVRNNQMKAAEQVSVSSNPSPLSLPVLQYETQPQESGAITPSKTSTTTLHINLLSLNSEKITSFSQQSLPASHSKENETPSHAVAATEKNTAPAEEKAAESVETVEEEKSAPEEDTMPAASAEETVNQLSGSSNQSKVRFTIAPAWQRSLSVEDAKESLTSSSPTASVSSSQSTVTGPGGVEVEDMTKKDPEFKAEPASSAKVELVLSPGTVKNAGTTTAKPQTQPICPVKPQTIAAATAEESSVVLEGNPDNPFGVRLRKTVVLHRFSSEEETTEPPSVPSAQPASCKVDSSQPNSAKPSISQPVSSKPALPKKPDVHGDSGEKNKRFSDAAAARGVSSGSDSPCWISMAKQKQKIYKENSLEEITVRKEEQERKSSLPMYISSVASTAQSNKTAESTGKVSPLEINKPPVPAEKEARRALSPPTPVPFQPSKSQSLPGPVLPKPHVPLTTAKTPPQPDPPKRSLSPPTPVPVSQKSPSCTSPPPPSKTATSPKTPQPQSTTLTSPAFSLRAAAEKSASRVPGLSSQTPSSQRGPPAPALPQEEPPWMALAKKKAKAWSEMPQIVQ